MRGYWRDSRLMAARTIPSESRGGSDPELARRRIGEKLDFPHSLIEFIEGGDAAFEQRAAILRGLDAVRTAVEQRYTEYLFCVGKRSRNGRLGYGESRCRFRHAARVGHGQENFQLAQLEPAPRALMSIHCCRAPYNIMLIGDIKI